MVAQALVDDGGLQEGSLGEQVLAVQRQFALDEIVYVLSGRGLTTVWAGEGKPKKNFEWQEHSMFLVPRNHWHVFSNMQGDKPVRREKIAREMGAKEKARLEKRKAAAK